MLLIRGTRTWCLVLSGIALTAVVAPSFVTMSAKRELAKAIREMFGGGEGLATVARPERVKAYRLGLLPQGSDWTRATLADYPTDAGPVRVPANIASIVGETLTSTIPHGVEADSIMLASVRGRISSTAGGIALTCYSVSNATFSGFFTTAYRPAAKVSTTFVPVSSARLSRCSRATRGFKSFTSREGNRRTLGHAEMRWVEWAVTGSFTRLVIEPDKAPPAIRLGMRRPSWRTAWWSCSSANSAGR